MQINKYFLEIVRRIKELDIMSGKGKLSPSEFRLILEIILEEEQGGKIISSELARRLGITRSAVSQIVTRLEEREIVKRVDSLFDKKIAYVELSDKAMTAFDEQGRHVNEVMDKVVDSFGEERLKALLAEYGALLETVKEVKKSVGEEI